LPFWELPNANASQLARLRAFDKLSVLRGYGDWVLFEKTLKTLLNKGLLYKELKLEEKDKAY
jgi:hypothetical protein